MANATEIMQSVLSGSVAIAGLVLVFTGFHFSQAAKFPPSTPDALVKKFRNAARRGAVPFCSAMVIAMTSFTWMVTGSAAAFTFSIWGFGVVLFVTLSYGAGTILLYL